MADELIEQRKQKLFSFLKQNYHLILLVMIIILGVGIRSVNNDRLKDSILELDPYLFLRWINNIVDTGKIPEVDMYRAAPLGFRSDVESLVMPYTVAYFYKFLHFLDPRVTTTNALSWYPLVAFALSLIPFFFMIKELFDKKTAVLACFFLSVIPGYLFRTFQSYGDKEPPALFTLYMAMYFFVKAWYSENKPVWVQLFWAAMAGTWAGIMALTWGGTAILYIACGGFALINFLFWFRRRYVMVYGIWLALYIFVSLYFTLHYGGISMLGLMTLVGNVGSLLALFALGVGAGCWAISALEPKMKQLQDIKLPLGAKGILFIGTFMLILLVVTGQLGPMVTKVLEQFIHPFERARHTLTVAENRQPYFPEWSGEFGAIFLWIAILGTVLLFWDMTVDFKGKKDWKRWLLNFLFVFMILGILFSRNTSTGLMDGVSGASVVFYLGSLGLFFFSLVAGYVHAYYKDRETYNIVNNMKPAEIKPWFILFFVVLCMISARGAARLFTILAPAMAIVGGYFFVSLWNKATDKIYKIGVIALLIFISAQSVLYINGMARALGPSMTPNWIETGQWIQENTPKGSIFAHWWDYGYWVQTLGDRPTVLDGGQPEAAWNYFLGRHVLTGQTYSEALNFLYSHNVSYFLIDPSDIGKYPAYASIGSDKNYDRLSYVSTFLLDNTRQIDATRYTFVGQFGFDEDYKASTGKIYPKGSGGVVEITMAIVETNTTLQVYRPTVKIVGPPGQISEPLQCVNVKGKEFIFNETGYPGCFVVLPAVDTEKQQLYDNAAGIFMSERGRNALWTKLYLRGYDLNNPYFERVFNSQPQVLVYVLNQGGVFGPITIWKMHYPEGMTVDPAMLAHEFPEGTFWE